MNVVIDNVDSIKNIDEKIDNSFNGTCFAYSWFLKLKKVEKILKIIDCDDEVIGFMPLFLNDSEKKVYQSTMYIPYGGPVIFDVPDEERNKIRYIREIETALANFLISTFEELNFSLDDKLIDIMPLVRKGFIPELRYTYKLSLKEELAKIYLNFGSDRKKEIRKAIRNNMEFYLDIELKYFSCDKCVEWEKKYNYPSSVDFVKQYITKTIEKDRGMCFVAKKDDTIYGAVHVSWDKKTAYILYSYFDPNYDLGTIAFLYYKIFEYLKLEKGINCIDFEGSVYETVENWNISFGSYQSRYYNLYFSKEDKTEIYNNLYIYFNK